MKLVTLIKQARTTPMSDSDRDQIAQVLQVADEKTLVEINRQGDLHLGEQLKLRLASDNRAMTFAGLCTTSSSLLIAAAAALANHNFSPLVMIGIGILLGCLVLAMALSIAAAWPTQFGVAGNNPKQYFDGIKQQKTFNLILAEQASFAARDIQANIIRLKNRGRLLRAATIIALFGLSVAVSFASYLATHGMLFR